MSAVPVVSCSLFPAHYSLMIDTPLGVCTIRAARSEELAVIMGMIDDAALWMKDNEIRQWPYPMPQSFWGFIGEEIVEGRVFVLADKKDEIVGSLRVEFHDEELWDDDPDGGVYVHILVIRRDKTGHKLGETLLEWARGYAKEHGRPFLRLDCVATNTRLRAYYESLGFQFRGEKEFSDWAAARYEIETS